MSLERELLSCVKSADPEFAKLAVGIARGMDAEQSQWIADLRSIGVKAAHPDDGWVDRVNSTVQFVYPQFNDGAGVGDLVALGWPKWSSAKPQHRIVKIIGTKNGLFSGDRFVFEVVP